MTSCYYSPSYRGIIGMQSLDDPLLCAHGTPISKLLADYPDMQLMSVSSALQAIDDAFKTKPVLTTEEIYHEMLNSQAPQNWEIIDNGTYFHLMSYVTGSITAYFAHYGDNFYTWNDRPWLKPAQVEALLHEAAMEAA